MLSVPRYRGANIKNIIDYWGFMPLGGYFCGDFGLPAKVGEIRSFSLQKHFFRDIIELLVINS